MHTPQIEPDPHFENEPPTPAPSFAYANYYACVV